MVREAAAAPSCAARFAAPPKQKLLGLLKLGEATRNEGLKWPHCDGLNWPHFVRPAADDAALIKRGSEATGSGFQSGVV